MNASIDYGGYGMMKLSIDQLRSVTHGALRLEKTDIGVRFWRMTEEQIQWYRDRGDEHQALGAMQSAGIRLAFWTDSRAVTFGATLWPDTSGIYGGFDVCEDGAMIAHLDTEYNDGTTFCVPLSEGEHLVEIYLPWSKGVTLRELSIDDGATLRPYHRSHKLLAFGDSITHGAHAKHPSLSYITRLANMLDADLDNRGVGGDKFDAHIVELEPMTDPDIVTVAYGTNDWRHLPRERFDRECQKTFEVLAKRYANARIFVISPIWRADWKGENCMEIPMREIYPLLCDYARPYSNFTVIDAWNFVPHLHDFFGDGVLHPNDLGMSCYAEGVYREIMKALC